MSSIRWAILLAAFGIYGHQALVSARHAQIVAVQADGNRATQRFRSSTNLVSLSVTVTDTRERHVPGLSKLDFAVYEDGKPQEITFFTGDPASLDLAILLDTSGSMSPTLNLAQDAAVRLLGSLRPGDRASFTEVKRGLKTLQPLTGDFAGVESAIRSTKASGETAIYQAVYVALRELGRAMTPGDVRRQALVILSDGDDTASLVSFDDVVNAARRGGVAIYSVSLRPPETRVGRILRSPGWYAVDGDFAMRNLALQTGGRALFHLSTRDLSRVCGSIARELAEQYSLGYVSADSREDGRFRQVAVRMLNSTDARARTRPGYFAVSPAPAAHHAVPSGGEPLPRDE